jgi:hypothetical protein
MSELPEWKVTLRVRVQKDLELVSSRQADHAGGAIQDAFDEWNESNEWAAAVLLEARVKPA